MLNQVNGNFLNNFLFSILKEEELVKSNQSYSLFESFTCESCLQSATAKLKVPRVRAPSPPQTKNTSNQPAPPLPSQPPPSLAKITPILISTLQSNQIVFNETKLLPPSQQASQITNCCCNCCRKNLIKSSFSAKIRSSTPEFEPYLANNSLNLSSISKTEPLIYIDSQEDQADFDMNSLLGKLKMKTCKKSENEWNNRIDHDYHHIDDSCDKQSKHLTPGDRVESFEFINLTRQEAKVVKYEPSWEDSTMLVVNSLRENLHRTMGRLSFRHKSYQLESAQRASFPPRLNNNSDDIERLLSASISDSDNKTMTDSSENSVSFSDSSVDLESASESWYQPEMPRENVLAFLVNRDIGSFVIRLSSSCKNCFALSIRVPYFANQHGVAHYLITKNKNGFKLKGVDKEFKTLKSLVTHYSVMQEILPVTLNLNDTHFDLSIDYFLHK
ncbi:tensin-2 isoform X3 [Brachionus plicatilis]|uniref:Tensin-2 isoform X3 n=1 Tax=Brachionus plicatilis TaxID=10195 RepID=A0A3M7SKJ6_BRAPC|nr:tensin-2 isoform X3 [Brachionus plicatilis]